MKTRKVLFIAMATFLLLACDCQAVNLPFLTATATPSPAPTPANPGTPTQAPPINTTTAPFNIAWDDRSLFKKRLADPYLGILDRLPGASIYHLAFSFSNPPTSITGVEEVRYKNQEKVSLQEVDFAIFPEILGGTIEIGQVWVDRTPITPKFSPGLMRVPLNQPLQPGQSAIFRVEFSISVPTQGGDFYYGIFGYNTEILSLAQAYPTILVYNEQGWNNQTPNLNGDPLFSDISFYLVSVDAPADLTLVTSGAEVDRHVKGGRQMVLYAGGPGRDFYLAASRNFEKQSEKVGGITYTSYAPASLAEPALSTLKTAEQAIDDFSRRYIAYPYTEFSIVTIITSAGGVEFPGMTAIADHVYKESNLLEGVVVHEVAHQWFYNLVGNETQEQPWLDESLAQFVTCQFYRDKDGTPGEQSCLDSMKGRWDRIQDQKIPIGEAVSSYSSNEYSAIVYGRGALFFDAMRREIGQAVFDDLMRNYTTTFAWDIATTDIFKKLAEQHCTCNLTPLFEEWVYP
jgi:hypothetical protein